MMSDISPEIRDYVIAKLGRSADRDAIITWVCEQRDCDWTRSATAAL